MLAGAARGARRSGPRGPRRGEGPRGRGSEGAGARPFPAPRGPRSPFPKSSYSFGVPSAALRARVPGRNGRAGRQRASRCGGRGGESHTPAPPGAQARAHTSHVEHTLRRTERRVGHARGRPLETAAACGEHHAGTAPRAARAEPSEDPAAPRPARVRGGRSSPHVPLSKLRAPSPWSWRRVLRVSRLGRQPARTQLPGVVSSELRSLPRPHRGQGCPALLGRLWPATSQGLRSRPPRSNPASPGVYGWEARAGTQTPVVTNPSAPPAPLRGDQWLRDPDAAPSNEGQTWGVGRGSAQFAAGEQ